ncbi:hypothetical protein ANN_19074 [Periplaneta americana]|uniref:MGS-like domain-containing protein n=1 Tax=Periplaneta americana TaxID=6978 RepID=A0ABQ8SRU3_PERAM|nr:hypothetical protein ANN_19074 [Periplaneta americana]
MRDRIIGPYFFAEKTVTANTYLDMLQLYAVPQLPDGAIFQQDGAPPHFANMVRTFLDEQFPARWIGRGSPYITWPARSPDLTPPDFFLWGLLRTRSTGRQYVIWQTYKKEFMLLSTMLHHRCFITLGSRLNTGWIVPPMEAMLRFMEHKVEPVQWTFEDIDPSGGELKHLADFLARKHFDLVINLPMRNGGARRVSSFMTHGYRTRRLAVDYSVPLVTDVKCAKMLVECCVTRYTTAVEARNRLEQVRGVNVSEWTVRRGMHDAGLISRRPAPGPELTRQHRQA